MAHGNEVEKLERRWMENPMGVSFAPLAEAYRRAGDHPRALEVLAIGLANHPAYVPALIVQARCHLDVREDGAAEESFMAVLATDGHNLIALKGLADICERSDRPEQARQHLDRLLEADPTHDEGRIQMDRLAGVLIERERLRGMGTGTAPLPTAEGAVPEAGVEPVEPLGFEPTDAGSQDDGSSPDDMTLSVEPLVEMGGAPSPEDTDAGDVPERPEPELIESVGWDAGDAQPLDEFEATEPDFAVEKDTAPFEAEEAGAPAMPLGFGDADATVEFEEESPAPWHDDAADEPVADAFRDELAVERQAEADLTAADTEISGASPGTESEASPDSGPPIWSPMGSPWAPAGAVEPAGQAMPPVDGVLGEEAPLAGAAEAEPAIEPELEPEPEPERVEWGALERDAVPARDAPTEIQADLPPAEPSSTVEDAEPWEPAQWPDPVLEELPAVAEAAEEAAVVERAPDGVTVAEGATDEAAVVERAPDGVTVAGGATDEVAVVEDVADEVMVVEGAESEIPADPEPEIEPALIMTETMARLFERQGHRTMALAIYAQLAEQAPGNHDLAAAVERLTGELSASPGTPGASGRGVVDAAAVDAIVGRGPSHSAPRARAHADPPEAGLRLDGPATRASEDLFSLSAVFGPARPGPAAPSAVFAPGTDAADREPSFDEFFGSEGPTASEGGPAGRTGGEDLEQFTAWLRSLKR